MDLHKINSRHSFVLLFFVFFLSPVISIFIYEIPFLTAICFFLIATIGISHGALDNIKGFKVLKSYGIKKKYFFYLTYIILSLLVILFWILFPVLILSLFLLIASYHFGKEDSQFIITKKRKFHDLSFLLKGSIIVLAPLMFHTEETIKIFEILNVQLALTNKDILLPFIILSLLSNHLVVNFKGGHYAIYFDWITIIILNWVFDPLVAFTIYFCFLHSIRHSISLIYEINRNNLKKGLKEFIKKALPLTIITGVLYLIAVFILTNSYDLDNAILKVIFIGLASLTFPHILLEYLLEKNEKRT